MWKLKNILIVYLKYNKMYYYLSIFILLSINIVM